MQAAIIKAIISNFTGADPYILVALPSGECRTVIGGDLFNDAIKTQMRMVKIAL